MRPSLVTILFCCALFTLPWVGVGTVHFVTGHDVGGGLQPSWAFLALAIVVRAMEFSRSKKLLRIDSLRKKQPSLLVLITLGSLLAVAISSIGLFTAPSLELLSTGWARWIRQLVQLMIMFSFLWFATLWVKGHGRWQLVIDLLFLGAGFQFLYGVIQGFNFYYPLGWYHSLEVLFTSNPSILSGSEQLYLNNVMQEIPRLRGTVCEPLYLGNFLLMVWPFLLIWQRRPAVRLALGLLLLTLMILTWSRGAWLGLLVQILLLGLILLLNRGWKTGGATHAGRVRRIRKWPWVMVGLALLLPVADTLSGGWMLQRLLATFNNQDWSNLTRLYSMKAAWLAFLQSPVTGVGWGQFAFHFPLLADPMGLQSQFTWPVVNNFPLQILCETGLTGFVVFIASALLITRKAMNILRKNRKFVLSHSLVAAALVSVVGVWIQLLSFSQYNLPHIWIGLGLLLAAINEEDAPDAGADQKESGRWPLKK